MAASDGIEVILSGGPAAGSVFTTDTLSWPPPKEVRIVTGGKKGPELLDAPDDEPRPGEHLHIYRQQFHGYFCRPCRLGAYYSFLRSAPKPAPTLFEGSPGTKAVS